MHTTYRVNIDNQQSSAYNQQSNVHNRQNIVHNRQSRAYNRQSKYLRETRTSVYAGSISPAKIVFCYKLIIESEFSDAERTGLPT